QALMLAQLLDELISVDLEVVRHARTPFSSPSARRSSRAHPTPRRRHPRCRNRSENEWRWAVECSLYTGRPGCSQLASRRRHRSAGRRRESDRVTELLGLGAGDDELDVRDLDAPQIGLLGRTKRHGELGDRAPIELVPLGDLLTE